jgi:Uma2 family endonuclease
MANPAASGYTAEDLDWLRNEINVVARLELDPWGSLIVAPTDDAHEDAVAILHAQAREQLDLPPTCVRTGFAWTVPGGTGYLMIPDLTIVAPGWQRVDDVHIDPPPLLVVEIASPSTRRVDRSRKLADYRLGGAEKYLLVDLPNLFELHDFAAGTVVTATDSIDLAVGSQPVRFSLRA